MKINREISSSPFKIVVSAAAVILFVQVAIGGVILWTTRDLEQAGQFGDLFGAVNALFSGLAFSGLIYTANLQRAELSLQRKELELTRTELARTAKAQEQAEVALRAQADAAHQSARLSAINFLLERYTLERKQLSGAFSAGSTEDMRRNELLKRERTLALMLDSLFDDLTAKDKIDDPQDR